MAATCRSRPALELVPAKSCDGALSRQSVRDDTVQKQDWRQAQEKARGSLPSGQTALVSRDSSSESHKESGKVDTVMS